ncbi:MAG: hypothetical protein ACUVXJ_19930, partial [Phycisphaerae bacterium]
MVSLLQRFARVPLGEIFADQRQISIYDDSLEWLNLPPAQFLDYARGARRTPYDGVKEDRSIFRQPATFLLSQAHRIWLTLNMYEPTIEDRDTVTLLYVGEFPF